MRAGTPKFAVGLYELVLDFTARSFLAGPRKGPKRARALPAKRASARASLQSRKE
jgi:hypothetical protein